MTPKKYPQNLHTQNNVHLLKPPKNNEIQNFGPPKNDPSLRNMYETIRVPHPPGNKVCGHTRCDKKVLRRYASVRFIELKSLLVGHLI